MNPEPPDRNELEKIDRWLAGEASAAECREIETLLERDPDFAGFVTSLRSARAVRPHDAADVERAWTALEARLGISSGQSVPAVASIESARSRRTTGFASAAWTRRAAVIAGAAILGSLLIWRFTAGSPADPRLIAETGIGESRTVPLADGSEVVLAPESQLLQVGGDARAYRIDGEGLVRVVADPAAPFRVTAIDARVDVLGTVFTVRARSGLPVRVAVTEGRVALHNASSQGTGAMLGPGDVGSVSDAGFVTVMEDAGSDRFTEWTSGRLFFEEETARVIANEVERWFDVEIQIPSPALASRRLTARFAVRSLDEVLNTISLTLNASWTRDGRTVVLAPRS
jgi:transmembrane sensor